MGTLRTMAIVLMSISTTVGAADGQTPASGPLVIVAELDGIIHPITAEYVIEAIDRADTSSAALVVIELRTPGGLLDSTRDIVSRMIRSRAPVVVFVGPSGARAASAGFVLTMAADVAVMAPGTHIGAAHPVSGTGEAMDETTSRKAAEDAAAYVRSLASARGRNVSLAAEAVMVSKAFTDREAIEAQPPLIDLVASDLADVVRRLDGRTVRRFDGRETTLRTAGATIERIAMTRRQRFLSTIANPQIAYLLLSLGMLGLMVELWNPGAILPGVAGGLCLLLAFFALQILPVDATALALIVFGMALLALEIKVPSFGALGIGGTISLIVGSVMLTRTVPGVSVRLAVIAPVAIALAAITLTLGRLALAAQRRPATTGVEGMIGAEGRTVDAILPGEVGYVDVHGEWWRATSRQPLSAAQSVHVIAVDGLTLHVDAATGPPSAGDAS